MVLELRQQLKLAQKLVMTPQLRQAIKLLQLNRLELTDALQAELEQNPLLEEAAEEANQTTKSDTLANQEPEEGGEPAVTAKIPGEDAATLAEINWADYVNTFDSDLSFARETPPADAPSQFDFISSQPGLKAHMQWQLSDLDLNDRELDIAMFIIGNLDRHGFLQADIADICAYAGCSEEAALDILQRVQQLDPPGIAARDIRESLRLQLSRKGLEDSLAYRIVSDHLNLLETRNYALIARKTGATVKAVMKEIETISGLVPFPGNEFSNEQTNYIVPDVYVFKVDGEYVIQLNNDGLPQLKLSDDYLRLLREKKGLNPESLGYLRDKQRSAEWFIKSLQQRQRTIYKVMESILKFQKEFFEHGPSHLKPLILRDVAEDIGMHESTVSRVTSNKYAHTPQGIYELKYFFSTAVATINGDTVASESIRNRIRQLVQSENPAKPLSDNKISEILARENIQVARRTVAKYRDQLGILPVKFRRKK
ncbi:MAG: RNA polymerase factor sigma-54 [Desulfobulbaceae bacterium]|jgi:RNA polymerase sigma-54 factor|nr:RNA polymerase factor sigma-54 [Desulfobulbaceae bacterium]MDY0350168.1 RNA polymerase factor sigma-54 [Desulfobulbaceae bacterium]